MGLFKELVLLPVAPLRGTVAIADLLAQEADRRLYDEDGIKRELLQLELDFDEGRISEAERVTKEEELMDRLAVARRRRTEEQEAETEEQEAEGWTSDG